MRDASNPRRTAVHSNQEMLAPMRPCPTLADMDPILLKVAHLGAAFGLFASLGAILLNASNRKAAAIVHGISLLLLLLVGFAILKKPPMGQSWWMIKVGLWLFLGVAPVLVRRKILPPWLTFLLVLAAGCTAAWLGIRKPF